MGRQHQGMDRPGVRQVPEGSGEQGKMEKTGCKSICGAPTTLAVKGLMMMMMMTKTMLPTRKSVPRSSRELDHTKTSDYRKETQAAVVWSCLPFFRYGQKHLTRHSERGKKTRQTEEEVGRQHQGMDRPGVRQVPEGSGEQGKWKKTGCKSICGAPTTLVVKGLMMMMNVSLFVFNSYCIPLSEKNRSVKHVSIQP